MADLSPVRGLVQLAASQFRAAVSEYMAQTLGGLSNFLAYYQHSEKQFFLNGEYPGVSTPQYASDGLAIFEFNAQIVDVWMFNLVAGPSGTTEIDLQLSQTSTSVSGGSGTALNAWTSIFTTLPAIAYNATHPAWVGAVVPSIVGSQYTPASIYAAPTNTTQPVLNTSITNFIPAWTAIQCILTTSQAFGAQNAGILVHYRPV